MQNDYSKSARCKLRKLAGVAHERQLAVALEKLYEQFNAWRDHRIDAFELNDRIHAFHQRTSREIWKLYNSAGQEDILVARALKSGLLTEDEIGKELVDLLEPIIR